jgi:hypothetical protein
MPSFDKNKASAMYVLISFSKNRTARRLDSSIFHLRSNNESLLLRSGMLFCSASGATFRCASPCSHFLLHVIFGDVHTKPVVSAFVRSSSITPDFYSEDQGKVTVLCVVAGRAARFLTNVQERLIHVAWQAHYLHHSKGHRGIMALAEGMNVSPHGWAGHARILTPIPMKHRGEMIPTIALKRCDR